MYSLPFVNRTAEINFFKKDVPAAQGDSKIILMHGVRGIGKSRLSYEAGERLKCQAIPVSVEISQSRAILHQDGYYLRMAGKAINSAAFKSKSLDTLEEFLKSRINSSTVKRTAKGLAKDIILSSKIAKTMYKTYQNITKSKEINTDFIFNSFLPEQTLHIADYIKHTLASHRTFLSIQNIQNIDSASIDLFADIFSESNSSYIVLEYTEKSENPWALDEIYRCFSKNNINIECVELLKLNINDVILLLKNYPDALESFVKKAYIKSEGNLRPLTDIDVRIQKEEWENIESVLINKNSSLTLFTENSISKLSSAEKLLLSLFSIHGESISQDIISKIASSKSLGLPIIDISYSLNKLCEYKLLKSEANDEYKVFDDEIVKICCESDILVRENFISHKALIIFYKSVLDSKFEFLIPQTEAIYFLVYLSIKDGRALEAAKYLDKLFFLAKNSLSPNRLIGHAKKIHEKISKENIDQDIFSFEIRLVEIQGDLGLSEDAIRTLEELSPQTKNKKMVVCIYKALLLEENSQPDMALQELKLVEENYVDILDDTVNLIIGLIRLACLRSKNTYSDIENLYPQILNNRKYKKLQEYGYVLRFSGSAYPSRKAVPLLEKSVDFFDSMGASLQEAHSRIELGVAYANIKRFGDAYEQFNIAEEYLVGELSERHTVLNNLACISFLHTEDYQEAFDLLRTAIYTAKNPFDRLAIHINTLIAAIFCGDFNYTQQVIPIIDEICRSDRPSDKEIRRIAYHNIALFYFNDNNLRKANEYLKMKNSFGSNTKEDYLASINERGEYASNTGFSIKGIPYHPCFMAHWHMELSNLMQRC